MKTKIKISNSNKVKIPVTFAKNLKIFVTGDPAAGKSTTAITLSESLGIPIYHIDKIILKQDGTFISIEEFSEAVNKILSENQNYVIEGVCFLEHIENNQEKSMEIFERIISESNVLINFKIPPRLTITRFVERINKSKEGAQINGFGVTNDFFHSAQYYKLWLDHYSDYLNKQEEREKRLSSAAHKTLTIKDFNEASEVIKKFKEQFFKR